MILSRSEKDSSNGLLVFQTNEKLFHTEITSNSDDLNLLEWTVKEQKLEEGVKYFTETQDFSDTEATKKRFEEFLEIQDKILKMADDEIWEINDENSDLSDDVRDLENV